MVWDRLRLARLWVAFLGELPPRGDLRGPSAHDDQAQAAPVEAKGLWPRSPGALRLPSAALHPRLDLLHREITLQAPAQRSFLQRIVLSEPRRRWLVFAVLGEIAESFSRTALPTKPPRSATHSLRPRSAVAAKLSERPLVPMPHHLRTPTARRSLFRSR